MRRDPLRAFVLGAAPRDSLTLSAPLDLVLVLRGECRVSFADGRFAHAALGSAIVAPVRGEHEALGIEARAPLELACFGFEHANDGAPREVLSPAELQCDARLAGLRDLLEAESHRTPRALDLARHLVSAFLLAVQARRREACGARDVLVQRALHTMRERLAGTVGIAELARSVGLSRAAFARRFREAVGEPPERHWVKLRLQRAAELLVASDDGMAAIAAEVGYASEFAFSRAFKRSYGVPPGAYRRRMRSGDRPRMAA